MRDVCRRRGSRRCRPRALRVDNLAKALRELVDNENFRQNAESIGEKLRQEDSIANAVTFIEAQVAALPGYTGRASRREQRYADMARRRMGRERRSLRRGTGAQGEDRR